MAETFETRLARLRRAAALQEGDRVPFAPKLGNLMASAYGLSVYDTMKDVRTVIPCASRFLDKFQPDLVWPVSVFPLDPCEYLGAGYIRMPGPTHGLPLDASFQMMDGTYMEDDEFDEFLLDPTHFRRSCRASIRRSAGSRAFTGARSMIWRCCSVSPG